MAAPLASLRSRVFAATALVAVLPTALALAFATRRVTQQAEEELSRGLGESVTEAEVNALKQWIEQRSVMQKEKSAIAEIPAPEEQPQKPPQIVEGEYCQEYDMQIIVAGECTMKDVRAMLVLGNLQALGTILTLNPPMEAIDEGKFDGTLHLLIASDAGEEALITAASGTDIAEVEILPAGKGEIQPPEKVPETIQQAATGTKQSAADKSWEIQTPDDVPDTIKTAGADAHQASPGDTSREIQTPDESQDAPKTAGADPTQPSSPDKTRENKNLRANIQQLDHIMNLVEDLVINRGKLKQIAEQHKIKEMDEAIAMVDRSVSELQNLMMIIRMIPLNHIFTRLPSVVRDVAQYDGKDVNFVIEGGETELDRSVMDGLNDPLLHLIRNSVNHGIESPDARENAGKPRKGNVRLSAHRDLVVQPLDECLNRTGVRRSPRTPRPRPGRASSSSPSPAARRPRPCPRYSCRWTSRSPASSTRSPSRPARGASSRPRGGARVRRRTEDVHRQGDR